MRQLIRMVIAALQRCPVPGLALAPVAQAAEDAQVSVLHGVPGAVVDVYARR